MHAPSDAPSTAAGSLRIWLAQYAKKLVYRGLYNFCQDYAGAPYDT